MRRSRILRATALLALATLVFAVWGVHRTIQTAKDSHQRLGRTQEVLMTAEHVLTEAVDAETAVRSQLLSASDVGRERFENAERSAGAHVAMLASLTEENRSQHQRIRAFQGSLTETFEIWRDLAKAGPGRTPSDVLRVEESMRGRMSALRRELQTIRLEEEQLLAERTRRDAEVVGRLEWMSTALMLLAAGSLACVGFLFSREASRHASGAESLQQQNEALADQIRARVAELSDANARLQSIINSAVDGIIVIDAAGRIDAFNPGAERLFGYPAAEVLGRNVSMLMPSPYHEEHDGYVARHLATGEAKIIGIGREVTGRRRDGSLFPLHLSVGEMAVGGERRFTGMLHDLSRRVALEEQLRASEGRWRAVIDSAVDGIIVIDGHGRLEAFNPAAERLFGHSEAEVRGQNVHMLMPSPYHEEHDTYLARYLATGKRKIIGTGREVTGLRRDGSTFPLHLSVGEISTGGERHFTGILHDLSARVHMEEQLREQASLARLGEMAAVIAHEVKNPLAGIRGAISIIGSRLPHTDKDGAIVKEIIARIDALNELMKDLLLFARPPQPHTTPLDVKPLVMMTAGLLKQDPAVRDVQVDVLGPSARVCGDAEMLKMVFQNLLLNGAHAMQGQGRMTVSISTPSDGACAIAFTDAGPGVPLDLRERIFMPFFTTKARGTGLGLATARRLVEAHHGRIRLECPPSGGTSVTVELPVLPA